MSKFRSQKIGKVLTSTLLGICILFVINIQAATYHSRATGNWNSATTWSTSGCGGAAAGAFPIAGDVVTICSGHTVTITANPTCLDLTIASGGILTTTALAAFTLTVSNNMDVQALGIVNIDGKGSLGGTGTSPGLSGANLGCGGGGYGGNGGNGINLSGGATHYGAITAPVDLGSGGGVSTGVAGTGGGALKIMVTGNLIINGIISADGTSATARSGGGSGGSIWLSMGGGFSGSGTIRANGGGGGNDGASPFRHGGGGGRISITGYTTNTHSGSKKAFGGGSFHPLGDGSAGTIYEKPAGSSGSLKVINDKPFTTVFTVLDLSEVAINSSIVSESTHLKIIGTQAATITGFSIDANSKLTGTTPNLTVGNNFTINGSTTLNSLTTLSVGYDYTTATGVLVSYSNISTIAVGHDYTIPAGANLAYSSLDTLTVGHDLIFNETLSLVNLDSLAVGNDYTISSGKTMTTGTLKTLTIGNNMNVLGTLTLASLGNTSTANVTNTITVASGGTITGSSLEFNAANMTVDGSFNLDGKGSLQETGSNPGRSAVVFAGSGGGGYGGDGGTGHYNGGKINYGSITAPIDLGSGGGRTPSQGSGGKGGGALKIVATNSLTINGSISAEGTDATIRSGGGSGGAIWLCSGTLTGNGVISANGGDGGPIDAGGGGGGRIATYYNSNSYLGTITAYGGEAPGSAGRVGGAGTIFSYDGTNHLSKLNINNRDVIEGGKTQLSITEGLTHNTVTVTNNAHLNITGTAAQTLRIDTLTIGANSSITGDGKGFTVNADFTLNGTMTWSALDTVIVGNDYTIASGATMTTTGLDTLSVNNDLTIVGTATAASLAVLNVKKTLTGTIAPGGYTVNNPTSIAAPITGMTPACPTCGVVVPIVSLPLPVEWLTFTASAVNSTEGVNTIYANGNSVQLEWSTATEINNDYFVVERSLDALYFEAVGRITGAGNSNKIQNYKEEDMEPYLGTSYYRIKQVDFNGKFAYSTTQMVNFEANNEISIFPNPSTTYIDVTVKNEASTLVTVSFLDLYGRTVLNTSAKVEKGRSTTRVNIHSIPKGMYVLKVTNGNQEHVQRQVILN
jgi:hypothetical protein